MITSLHNPLIKRIRSLVDRRDRRREGVFLIEGEKELIAAIEAGIEIEAVVWCPDQFAGDGQIVDEQQLCGRIGLSASGGPKIELVSDAIYAKLAYRKTTGGLIAIGRTPQRRLADLRLSKNPLLLVLIEVEKPGNVGAILRTADAAGVDAVLVCDEAVDLYNPNVVRSSLGALFTVPTIQTDTPSLIAWLRQQGVAIIAASPAAKQNYTAADYTGPVAVAVGAEHRGLPGVWLEKSAQAVKIPMFGKMDSLNVSASAAIILFEALRQRSERGEKMI